MIVSKWTNITKLKTKQNKKTAIVLENKDSSELPSQISQPQVNNYWTWESLNRDF